MAIEGDPIYPDVEMEEIISSSTGKSYGWQAKDWREEERWLDEEFNSQPKEGLKGCIIRFQIADGYAMYKVGSLRPLTLHHIRVGDSYRIPNAHLRGLDKKDIEFHVEGERQLNQTFKKKQA